jgi:hypothetical protein
VIGASFSALPTFETPDKVPSKRSYFPEYRDRSEQRWIENNGIVSAGWT